MSNELKQAMDMASESDLNAAYLALAREWSLWEAPLHKAVAHITESVSRSMHARRASLWLLNDSGSALELFDLFHDGEAARHSSGATLRCANFPAYFAAMEGGRVLAASDAHTDYRTREFSEVYLAPEGIGAMLDATLRKAGQFVGVLCVEHVGGQRLWNQHEQRYVVSVADLVMQRLVYEDTRRSELRYRALFESAGDSIFLVKGDRFIDCNEATLRMFGCSREQILDQTPYHYSPEHQPDGRPSQVKALEKINAAFAGETQFFEWQHMRHDGTRFDAEVTLNSIAVDGEPHLLAMVRDISSRKLAEQHLERSRQALLDRNESLRLVNELSSRLHGRSAVTTIVDATLDTLLGMQRHPHIAIYLLDTNGRELRLASCHGFENSTLEAVASLPLDGSLSGVALAENCLLVSQELRTDDRIAYNIKALLVEEGFRSATVIPLVYDGQALGSVNLLYPGRVRFGSIEIDTLRAIGRTVSLSLANARYMAEMEYLAHHDSLTRLPNRAILHREFERRAADGSGRYASAVLMLLDLDRFKEVNDTLGHYVGDALLKQIGPRLGSLLESQDSLLCRLGGDEFTILVSGLAGQENIEALAGQLLTALRQPFHIDHMKLELDASIGIAVYPEHGSDSHALLRSADVAMYEAKRRGGGYAFYDRQLDPHSSQRLAIMSELEAALSEQQLCLHYQPKVALATGRITGFEALVRWQHPSRGLLYPDSFIPVAEVSDAIHQLSQRVLELALQQQQLWCEAGHDFSVSVNLSARDLVDDRCFRGIESLLVEYQVAARRLELEITESALMQDPEGVMKLLERVAGLGVRLSIDDFGTGYSSLSYLRRLPLHALKVDRLFVGDMLHDEQHASIVRSVITLAHNLDLQVVAEGVEDADTLDSLRAMHCDVVQGYHVARPAAAREVARWLADCRDWSTG